MIFKANAINMNNINNKYLSNVEISAFLRVLPNKMNMLDRYHGKVFCGTFARDGDVFMSAAQGMVIVYSYKFVFI